MISVTMASPSLDHAPREAFSHLFRADARDRPTS
jgi:hypothetical protein